MWLGDHIKSVALYSQKSDRLMRIMQQSLCDHPKKNIYPKLKILNNKLIKKKRLSMVNQSTF